MNEEISNARQEFLESVQKFPELFERQAVSSSRRGFLRGTAAAGVAVGAAGVLGACATKTSKKDAAAPAAGSGAGTTSAAPKEGKAGTDKSDTEKILNFSNWPQYIDADEKDKTKSPTLDAFKAQTGIEVKYTEDVNSNDDFYAKIHQQLAAGQDTGRDLMVLSDWMIAKVRQLGYIQALNTANIPNLANIDDGQKNPAYDPGRKHTVPWALGFTLIGVNTKAAGRKITSIKDMMTSPDFKGKIGYFSEMEDGTGFAMLALGYDPANFTADQFNEAVDYIQKAKDRGQIRKFTGNDYISDLTTGNFAACMAYSGDVAAIDAPDVEWIIPDEGMLWFTDNMCIPSLASHKTNAEKFMNYMLDPKVGATLDDFINYIPSMNGADAAMKDIDADALKNQLIFPDAATKAKAHQFKDLDLVTLDSYIKKFNTVTSG